MKAWKKHSCLKNTQIQTHQWHKIWKLKKALFPKKPFSLPAAKLDYQNKIVSNPNDLTELLCEEYGRIRLRKRPTHPLVVKERPIRNKVFKMKLNIASKKKAKPFQMTDLEVVLKAIPTNKARDPEGLCRIKFKNSIIGSNLKESLLILFNKLKAAGKIPFFF